MKASSAAASSGHTPRVAQDSGQTPAHSHASSSKFSPENGWTLISQGAEARVWKTPGFRRRRNVEDATTNDGTDAPRNGSSGDGMAVVAKERFSKRYRHPKLDERLTTQRCRMEARILQKCAKRPDLLRVPAVLDVEAPVLYLEYLPFPTLRQHLDDMLASEPTTDRQAQILRESVIQVAANVGRLVSNLHYGLGVVHGDLTTSNFLIDPTVAEDRLDLESQKDSGDSSTSVQASPESTVQKQAHHSEKKNPNPLVLIDFGLAKNSESAEERAVDLYVLERALLSTHPQLSENFFDSVLAEYGGGEGPDNGRSEENPGASNSDRGSSAPSKMKATLTRLEQVRLRGRKRECFG